MAREQVSSQDLSILTLEGKQFDLQSLKRAAAITFSDNNDLDLLDLVEESVSETRRPFYDYPLLLSSLQISLGAESINYHLDSDDQVETTFGSRQLKVSLSETTLDNGLQVDFGANLTQIDGEGKYAIASLIGMITHPILGLQQVDIEMGRDRLSIRSGNNTYIIQEGSIINENTDVIAFPGEDLSDQQIWEIVGLLDEVMTGLVRPAITQM